MRIFKGKKRVFGQGLLLAAAAAGAALLLAPSNGRVDDASGDYEFRYWVLSPIGDFFALRPGPDGGALLAPARLGVRPSDLPKTLRPKKDPGTRRVFVVGGSVVQGFAETRLKEAFEAARPGTTYEVIDTGMANYDSSRDRLTFEEVLRLDPDLVVLMSGADEGEGFEIGPFDALRAAAAGARRGRALRGLKLAAPGLLADFPRLFFPVLVPGPGLDDFVRRFSANLKAMLDAARQAGVEVVVCTLPWNVADWPPFGGAPLEEPAFLDAWLEFETGRWEPAALGFRKFLKDLEAGADPGADRGRSLRGFGWYFLGRSLARSGSFEEAREAYRHARATQHPPLIRINEIIRRLAPESGAAVAELEQLFERSSPHGIVGAGLFEDDAHWERFADAAVAAEILRAASGGAAGARAGAPTEDDGREKSWRILARRVWDVSLSKDERLSERLIALLETIHEGRPDLTANIEGLRPWIRARVGESLDPGLGRFDFDGWWPLFLAHAGEFRFRRGEYGLAESLFGRALELSPELHQVRVRRGASRLYAGDAPGAKADFSAVRKATDRFPEIEIYSAMDPRTLRRLAAPPSAPPGRASPAVLKALLREGEAVLNLPSEGGAR